MDGIFTWIERLLDGSLFAGGIFLIIGIVGGVLLLISLLLDGIFDAFDFGDGPLSLTTIAAFTAIFGFTSFASVGAGMSTPVAAIVGALAGVVGGAAAWWLSRLIRNAESTTAVSGDDLVGSQGSVVLAIPQGGLGEVALTRHGERISLSATAAEPIPRGTAVRVIQIVTSTSVRVEPLEPAEPIAPAAAPEPQQPSEPSDPAERSDHDPTSE
ncbi:NfeD family protein [Leucobacter celer]|jgi:membrane-bound ClpP family serine protease|uniref:NfeD family protein n=1 Tax=Leucobacter celer TaxID=668625 RepID=UPI0006A7C29E|nr:NfeD family protein [Leucobacter celer]